MALPAVTALTAAPPKLVSLLLITIITTFTTTTMWGNKVTVAALGGTTWCVARSDASIQALQTALDYACGAGADCLDIQSNGLCYLPNTIQAHASFAFNSFYQRKGRAPGSCNFAGTSTIAQTDPSYGSCVYSSSASTAGGTNTPTTTPSMNNPNAPTPPTTTTSPTYSGGSVEGLTPAMNPTIPENSGAPSKAIITTSFFFSFFSFPVVLFCPFHLSIWLCMIMGKVGGLKFCL